MLSNKVQAQLDRALASGDPSAALAEVARSLKSQGWGQYPLYRLLGEYQSGMYDPCNDAVENVMDLAWGAPWAKGEPLFDRPLVEEAALAARATPYSVNELLSRRKTLDGQPVRVVGELMLGMEITSLWHDPASERRPEWRSSLALGGSLSRWLRLEEYEGRREEGVPLASDGRAVMLWLFDQFAGQVVEFLGMVDLRNTGHMGLRPAGLYRLSIAKIRATG